MKIYVVVATTRIKPMTSKLLFQISTTILSLTSSYAVAIDFAKVIDQRWFMIENDASEIALSAKLMVER